jgi:hypothetical protein
METDEERMLKNKAKLHKDMDVIIRKCQNALDKVRHDKDRTV